MEHIGIDLGASHSHVVVLTEGSDRVQRLRVETASLPLWLRMRAPAKVTMEACTQSAAIARAALAAKHETKVIPGHLVRALGVGARGIKTDDRDAENLGRASMRNIDLPSVHLRSESSQARREVIAARAILLKARKGLAAKVKGWLRGRLIHLKSRANTKQFCHTVRETALKHPDGLPLEIELLLQTFEHLTEQIERLNSEIETIASEDPICAQLMTMPGVGPHIAFAFTAQVDDPHRFASADELGSYLALVPGENTTGGKVRRTSTIKAGPQHLKAMLVQGSWSLLRCRPNDPIVLWARSIAERRNNKRIAVVALARKMASILWAMWKHGTTYDPARASSVRASKV